MATKVFKTLIYFNSTLLDKTSEINLTVEGVEPLELFGENNLKLNLLVALMKMVPYQFESNYRKLLHGVTSEK